jgi:hypothetical protein
MTWILVFWLQFPENFTVYDKFATEQKCVESAQAWDRRLRTVKSKLVVECREAK